MDKKPKVEIEENGVKREMSVSIDDIFTDTLGWFREYLMLNKIAGKVKLYFDGKVVAES
jgi:hypothetical protein